jgi:membrane protein implicated in regulation of membrane protease activity
MIVIGLLLVVLAVLVAVAMFLSDAAPNVELALGPVGVDIPPSGVFMLGVAAVLILLAGLVLLRTGLRRWLRQRREIKEARAVVAEQEHRGYDDRTGTVGTTGPTTGPTAGPTTGPAESTQASPPPQAPAGTDPDTHGSTR